MISQHQLNKMQEWRNRNPSSKIVLVSGGFDPPHTGHCHLILGAAVHGSVIVALNSDAWLVRKKGYRLMPFVDRANVMLSFKNVGDVLAVDDDDDTVCQALQMVIPDYFANGGDRHDRQECSAFFREHQVCEEFDIVELFNVGGLKMQSSTNLVRAAAIKIFDLEGP